MAYIDFKVIHKWNNDKDASWQATDGKTTILFTTSKSYDKIGVLYTVECSKTGYFQEYGIGPVKHRIKQLFSQTN